MSTDLLIRLYTKTYDNVCQQTSGLTHEDSVMQFAFGGNCLNWNLGHIVVSRWNILALLGNRQDIWTFDEARRYIPGSDPILSADEAIALDKLLAVFDKTQTALVTTLSDLSPSRLASPVENGAMGGSLEDELAYYLSHEAYHAGQIELCRRLAGKHDSIDFN